MDEKLCINKLEICLSLLSKNNTAVNMKYCVVGLHECFKHHTGNIYVVKGFANYMSQKAEYEPSVVYMGSNGHIWVKTAVQFAETMEPIKPSEVCGHPVYVWSSTVAGKKYTAYSDVSCVVYKEVN